MDYKEKLEEAKELYKTANADQKYALELLFPELKRNEEERIRKELLEHCKNQAKPYIHTGNKCPQIQSWIAWLERQGEQKPVDKSKPKFKVGDWITDGEAIFHVTSYDIDYGYQLETQKGTSFHFSDKKVENKYHLWNIQDAKDGDVLYSLDSKQSFIFKHRKPNEQAEVYCGINIYGKFFVGNTKDCIITTDKYIPATNAQRDNLFAKMKDAGYEWNADKKELKKIEQEPAWSEEDEKNLIEIINIVQNISSYDKQYDRYINWLKSIRQRYTWKPTKEQMYMLEWLTTNVLDDGVVGNKAKEVLNTLIEQLKSL